VAVLPVAAGITGDSYLHPAELTQGFHTAVLIAAAVSAAGGVLAFASIRNPAPRAAPLAPEAPRDSHTLNCLSCALEAPPLRTGAANAEGPAAP
jgi:hypothetical protein